MSTPAPFEVAKQIRFHHCDPAGIVFYPQYFVLMNELVEDWFNEGLGVDFARFHTEERRGIPMAHVECDFLAPSKDRRDAAVLACRWRRSATRSLRLAVEAKADDEVARARDARRRACVARHPAGRAVLRGVPREARALRP